MTNGHLKKRLSQKGAVGIDDEDFDLEDEETIEEVYGTHEDAEEDKPHPLLALAEMMDEHDISAQRLFNDFDADGNGQISMTELTSMLSESTVTCSMLKT